MEVVKNHNGEVIDKWEVFGQNFKDVLENTARFEQSILSSPSVELSSRTVAYNGLLASDLLLSKVDITKLHGSDFGETLSQILALGFNLRSFNPSTEPTDGLTSNRGLRTPDQEAGAFNEYLLKPLKGVINFFNIIKIEGANKRQGFVGLLSSSGMAIDTILKHRSELGLELSDDDENKLFEYLFKAEYPNFESVRTETKLI